MIRAEKVSLRRGPNTLVRDADFELYAGQRLGLTGDNGSGKSSLLATILGELDLDSGDISIPADWVIAHVAQETPAVDRSALDYTLDGDRALRRLQHELDAAVAADDGQRQAELHASLDSLDAWTAESRAHQLLNGLGFSREDTGRAVRDFSGGWRVRLNLAQALMCRSDLLLLDEPTNHLDLDAIVYLERWLKHYEGALILISHDREFLNGVVDRVAHIANTQLKVYTGNYSEFERQRAAFEAQQASARERQQKQRDHMQAFVDRFRAKATKAKQAQSRLKALARLPDIAAAVATSGFSFRFETPEKLPQQLLALNDASVGYGEAAVIEGVDLSVVAGSRIGLIGANGAGKSTLIKALAGDNVLNVLSGSRDVHMHSRIGYFAQHQLEQLRDDQSPVAHLKMLDPGAQESQLRTFIGRFGFSNDKSLSEVGPFSGGERARLALAMLIYQKPNVLLLDEPTNHLDLMAREALALALQDFGGALVVISHDRHLLRSCCDEFVLVDSGRCTPWDDDLDSFAQWLMTRNSALTHSVAGSASPAASKRDARRDAAQTRVQLQPLRTAIKQIEAELKEAQTTVAAVQQRLADPALYAAGNGDELQALTLQDAQLRSRIADLEERWLSAEDELDTLQQSAGKA